MKTFAVIFMVVAAVVIIAVDIGLALNRHKGDTFSSILRAAGRECIPLIIIMSFGMGLLAGHWWWQ